MCLLFIMELARRLVQCWSIFSTALANSERDNTFDDLVSGKKRLSTNDDLRLVPASVAAFIVLWFVKEDAYSSPVLAMVLVVTAAYVAFKESPWGLVRQSLKDYKSQDVDEVRYFV